MPHVQMKMLLDRAVIVHHLGKSPLAQTSHPKHWQHLQLLIILLVGQKFQHHLLAIILAKDLRIFILC